MKDTALSLIRGLPIGAVRQESILFYLKLGYWPDLVSPKTYNEKLNFRKLFVQDQRCSVCSDKLAVREWVRKRIGEEYLIPLLYSGESITGEELCALGDNIVAKANHDCMSAEIIRQNSPEIADAAAARLRAKLRVNYGRRTNQFFYSAIKPMVVVERLLSSGSKPVPDDFKILCFRQPDGSLKKWMDVHENRNTPEYRISFYGDDKRLIPLAGVPNSQNVTTFPCDEQWNHLHRIADALGQEFDHVRVDLYWVDGKIYFGELSFCGGGGRSPYSRAGGSPNDLDREIGSYWHMQPGGLGGTSCDGLCAGRRKLLNYHFDR